MEATGGGFCRSDLNGCHASGFLTGTSILITKKDLRTFSKRWKAGLSKLGETSGARTKAIRDLIYLIKDVPMDGRRGLRCSLHL